MTVMRFCHTPDGGGPTRSLPSRRPRRWRAAACDGAQPRAAALSRAAGRAAAALEPRVGREQRHRGVVPAGDAADAAAAPRAGAAQQTLRVRGLDAPARRPRPRRSANGHDRSRWKMLPPGMPQLALEVERRLRLDAGLAVASRQQAVGDRLGEHGVERAQRRRRAAPRARRRCRRANSRAGVCRPKRVSVCAPAACSSGPEDRRVGERVAVDLARAAAPGCRRAAACA